MLQNTGKCRTLRIRSFLLVLSAALLFSAAADAQYFGRNKPGYRSFSFDVAQTPNFDIYHYLNNDSLVRNLSQWSEDWYRMHQGVFRDTFNVRNPVIFYSNHPDFQQTNTISGIIGTGTGGVTESLKNRVIMPVALSLAQTDHTLGHELVHAFQYNLFLNADSGKKMSINNIPLWMIEGMAEYLSLGSVDPNTAMWMRDALLNDDFPTLKQMTNESKYFPYRYGHAFWSMAGKTWGDSIMIPLLTETSRIGFSKAADSLIGFDEKTLSGMWKSAMETYYRPFLKGKTDSLAGRLLVSEKVGGRMNVSPSVSPDGRYFAFFSQKNLFTLDLFLADAGTGKVIRKLSSVVRNNDIDDFNFIESSGTWSPDGKRFAFIIFSKGTNKLVTVDVRRGKAVRESTIPGIASFSNPSWSPDGKKIVVTGMREGVSDLYLYDLETFEVEQLTHDLESNLHPSWSSDGRFIVYSQEKMNLAGGTRRYSFDIAVLDLGDRTVRKVDVFNGAYNMNPYFSGDDRFIYFLSDADGFRNLYKYDIENARVFRLTSFMTGISGITPYSPAISVARDSALILYNHYWKNSYRIAAAYDNQFNPVGVDAHTVDFTAATLPPGRHFSANIVDNNLTERDDLAVLPSDSIKMKPYRSKFQLDYISNNANIGVSTGIYRNNVAGSINMLFSDMVGNNQLYSSVSLNGEIYDFGGQAAYVNQKGKVKWGAALSHTPYRAGNMFITRDTVQLDDMLVPVDNLVIDYLRMFEDNVSLFASYPLSQTRRFEANVSLSWYYYRLDRYNNYYLLNGVGLASKKEKLEAPGGSNYQQISAAYVEDNSYSGMTSPMQGHRARLQVDKYFGAANIFTTLIDYRQYFYVRPFTLAFRFYNLAMLGKDAENGILPPIYIGYPWLIRGYNNISYTNTAVSDFNRFNISVLTGSRVAVANAELRFPLSGPERLAAIKSKWFLIDLNLFFDSGLAWNSSSTVVTDRHVMDDSGEVRYPVFSTGASLRVNLLGYMVIEPYYAIPLQNGGLKNAQFGLSFTPGW